MCRYFFNLRDGKELVRDSDGRELDSDELALDEGKRVAAHYAKAVRQGTRHDLVVEVLARPRRFVGNIPLPH